MIHKETSCTPFTLKYHPSHTHTSGSLTVHSDPCDNTLEKCCSCMLLLYSLPVGWWEPPTCLQSSSVASGDTSGSHGDSWCLSHPNSTRGPRFLLQLYRHADAGLWDSRPHYAFIILRRHYRHGNAEMSESLNLWEILVKTTTKSAPEKPADRAFCQYYCGHFSMAWIWLS